MRGINGKKIKKGAVVLSCMLVLSSGISTAASQEGGWASTENGLVYIDPSTGTPVSGLVQIDSEYYYFDEVTGIMLTGFVTTPDGVTCYFDDYGKMLKGWQRINDGRYYFLQSDGSMVKGDFITWNDDRYYFDADGKMVRGFCDIDGKTYYFSDKGEMLKGWRNIDGLRYYFLQDDGSMVKNHFVTWKENQYYLSTDGKMTKGLCTLKGKTYYFAESGEMLKGWRNINGYRYYFLQSDGSMVQNHFVTWKEKKYYFGADGKMVTGPWTIDDKDYYFSENGEMLSGWRNIDGFRYYFLQSDGTMVKNHTVTWNDNMYFLGSDGRLVTDKMDFEMEGEHYRIDSDGVMLSASDSFLYLCNNNGSLNRTLGIRNSGFCALPTLENPRGGTFIGWSSASGLQLDLITPTQITYEPGDQIEVNGISRVYAAVFMNNQDVDIDQAEITKPSENLGAVIFIGDSRLKYLDRASAEYQSSQGNLSFITKNQADLEWLVSEGYITLANKINEYRLNTDKPIAVVFQLGLFDIGKEGVTYDGYISVINQIAGAFSGTGCNYYYMSVLPVNPSQMEASEITKPRNIDVQKLRDFNSQISAGLPQEYTYIDLYSWMKAYGYRSDDGLQFSDATNRRILNETIKRINRDFR